MRSLLAAMGGLTTRGRSLLAAGLALVVCSVLLGQRDLLRVGVFLAFLPLCAVLIVSRTRYRLSCSRLLDPTHVEVGRPSTVRLRLDNVGRLPSGTLLMEDTLPYALGGRPRFVLDRVEPQGIREVSYPVRSDARGRYRIGPLAIRIADPFGLVELARSFSAVDDLVVTPVVSPLPDVRVRGEWSVGGEAPARAVSASGHDDAATREYREGDDLRKVHWRSTARTGELMVRREEQPFTSRATLVLDDRAVAHHGSGPGSSLEWAVSAIASIGVNLHHGGYGLRLIAGEGVDLVPPNQPMSDAALLEVLATIVAGPDKTLGRVVDNLRRTGVDGVLVAVLGETSEGDAQMLAQLRHGVGTCIAVLMDTPTWQRGVGASAAHAAAASVLSRAGWRVLRVEHGTTLASVWGRLGARNVHSRLPA